MFLFESALDEEKWREGGETKSSASAVPFLDPAYKVDHEARKAASTDPKTPNEILRSRHA